MEPVQNEMEPGHGADGAMPDAPAGAPPGK